MIAQTVPTKRSLLEEFCDCTPIPQPAEFRGLSLAGIIELLRSKGVPLWIDESFRTRLNALIEQEWEASTDGFPVYGMLHLLLQQHITGNKYFAQNRKYIASVRDTANTYCVLLLEYWGEEEAWSLAACTLGSQVWPDTTIVLG